MREAEQQYGMDTPLVVFTDQTPVDSDLNAIAPSLMRLQRQNPQAKDYRQILWRCAERAGEGIASDVCSITQRSDI